MRQKWPYSGRMYVIYMSLQLNSNAKIANSNIAITQPNPQYIAIWQPF